MVRSLVAGALVALVLSSAACAGPPMVPDDVDPAIPTPDSVIGHAVGAKAVRYDDLERYLHALDESSDLVSLHEYARTHEGRALSYLVITSPQLRARLDDIKADNASLHDPRALDGDGDAVIARTPAIAWLAYSIHGDEVSPCDSAMVVAYRLVAGTDEATRRLRDEMVILIDPLQNPDGRDRFLAQIETLTGAVPNADIQAMHHAGLWSAGRGNHYLFDLNRDWLPMVHPETQGRAAALREWQPHLVVDAHEMGGLDTYLFDPPRDPLNLAMPDTAMKWRRAVSRDQAAAFDAYGWSYYTGEWYEEWYPGYTNAWANLRGAIGILYEQAGVNGSSVRQAAGNEMTYAEAVHHNVVGSFANLETLRASKDEILRDLLAERRVAVGAGGDFATSFVVEPGRDGARFRRFAELLDHQGIEYMISDRDFRADGVTGLDGSRRDTAIFEAGALVVPARQPMRRLAHALLDFDPRMPDETVRKERVEIERGRGSRMYDVTAWNLPMAYGLTAYTVEDHERVMHDPPPAPAETEVADAAFGHLVPFDDGNVYVALARLLEAGAKVRVASRPFTHGGRAFEPGTLLLRGNEQSIELATALTAALDGLGLEAIACDTALSDDGPDLGGRRFPLLHRPRVAIASQFPISTTSFGATWHLLDARIGLRTSPINAQSLGRIDLRRYDVLILPSAGGLGAVLDDGTKRRLRTWIEGGGTLIALGGAAANLADEHGLSDVRRRRDVLGDLDEYAEAVAHERAALDVEVDFDALWEKPHAAADDVDTNEGVDHESGAEADDEAEDAASDDEGAPAPPSASGSLDERKRADARARRFAPQGAIVAADVDVEHWLAFGLPARLPVPVAGSTVLLSKAPVETPVRLTEVEALRLSGLLWPEARDRLASSAWATRERVGNGQVILFAHDPCFRGYWEATQRMLLNAVFLGPGFGTRQPLPW